jgi:hypothetical protein
MTMLAADAVARMLRIAEEIVPDARVSGMDFGPDAPLMLRILAGVQEITATGPTPDLLILDLAAQAVASGVGQIPTRQNGEAELLGELLDEYGDGCYELTVSGDVGGRQVTARFAQDGRPPVKLSAESLPAALAGLREQIVLA